MRSNLTSISSVQAPSSFKGVTCHLENFAILVCLASLREFVLPEVGDGVFSFEFVFGSAKFLTLFRCFCLNFLHLVACFSFTQDLSLVQ